MSTSCKLKANGKLLITGEYLVMNGAKALAFPLCYGQEMQINPVKDTLLNWNSKQNNDSWFTASFQLTDFKIIETSQTLVANHLSKILTSIRSLNPEFLLEEMGYHVEVNANYPLEWGLGSSSSLISMLASWANVNEYSLYGMISNGSAYDLACASHQQPIFYQLKNKHAEITETVFGDGLKKYSLFAYLGNKQSSQTEIERYQKMETPSFRQIERISELADEFCRAADARELMAIVEEHESILSTVLKKPSIKQREFQKFSGTVKSLGAWGGDFAMFTTEKDLEDMKKEIIQFGISQIFSYDELKIKV